MVKERVAENVRMENTSTWASGKMINAMVGEWKNGNKDLNGPETNFKVNFKMMSEMGSVTTSIQTVTAILGHMLEANVKG